jgi:hypothetical protein
MNLVGAKLRHETLEGKEYIVAPTIMITEGVLNGSEGPLLYQKEEYGKNPLTWNHKPIVLYHPTLNGEGTTACDPRIIETQKVGLMLNTFYDGRLGTESWLDKEKLSRMDRRVLDDLEAGKSVEVSTGLYHDRENKPGIFNGKHYTGIVRNIQPDHLAILPNEKGACSLEDGAGLLRNAAATGTEGLSYDDIREQIRGCLKSLAGYDYVYVCDVYPKAAVFEKNDKTYKVGYKLSKGKVVLDGTPEEVRKVTNYVTANGQQLTRNDDTSGPLTLPEPDIGQLSDVMKHQQFQSVLEKKYSGVQQEGDWGGWVTDIYANYVIWVKDGKHFRLPYTYDDDKISFTGEPEEVTRVSEYRRKNDTPIDGTSSPYSANSGRGNMAGQQRQPATNVIHQGAHQLVHEPNTGGETHNEPGKSDGQARSLAGGARKQQVDTLIAKHGWKEEDRTFLEGLPDDHFAKINSHSVKGASEPIVPYSYEGIGDRSDAPGRGAMNQQQTVEQYMKAAPPEVQEMLQNSLEITQAEKSRLVGIITSNKNNVFNPAWLMGRKMGELRGLAALCGGGPVNNAAGMPNYGGQAEVPMFLNSQQPTNNTTDEPEVLQTPTINWDDEKKKSA